jgi:L-threonylcarbamoyladenylate synthase
LVADFDGVIDMIVDGGEPEYGLESTIIDLTCGTPTILRPGAITKAMIETIIGEVRTVTEVGEMDKPKAPGMKYRHYAPKAEIILIKDNNFENIPKSSILYFTETSGRTLYSDLRDFDERGVKVIYAEVSQAALNDEAYMNRLLKAAKPL